jgi:hypothetical protein
LTGRRRRRRCVLIVRRVERVSVRLIVRTSRKRRSRTTSFGEIDSFVRVRVGRMNDVRIRSNRVVRGRRRVMELRLRIAVRLRYRRRETGMRRRHVKRCSAMRRRRRTVRVREAVVSVSGGRRDL